MSDAETSMRVVIAGAGVAGAMAAAALGRSLPAARYQVTVARTRGDALALGPFGAVEAGLGAMRAFHALVGLDEAALVAAGASFSLGTAYSGWSAATYFAPFGDIGATLHGAAFHQIVARLRAAGEQLRLADYSIAAVMAQAGRFTHPAEDAATPLATFDYGYHLPQEAYAAALLAIARRHHVGFAGGTVAAAECNSEGEIAALRLDDDSRVEGDVFIDASGPAGLVMGALPGDRWQNWAQWLACDRALHAAVPASAPPAPYAHVAAHRAGWHRSIPGRVAVGQAMAFSSAFMSDAQAADVFGADGTHGPVHRFEPGRRARPWSGNCVAIGASAALLEPTAPMALDLVRSAVERLLELFPTCREMRVEAREYNRLAEAELDRTRDFAILRYKCNGRVGEPMWDAARSMAVPPEVEAKLALYESRGRVNLLDGDRFEEADFAALLDAHGVRARRYDALADAVPVAVLKDQLSRMRAAMLQAVAPLPLHGDALDRLDRLARRGAA